MNRTPDLPMALPRPRGGLTPTAYETHLRWLVASLRRQLDQGNPDRSKRTDKRLRAQYARARKQLARLEGKSA